MARKPDFVEEFIPYTRLSKKMSIWRSVVASRMEYAKHLIANKYKVDPDRVRSIFLKAWDSAQKDYPSPKFPKPSSTKEFESFNSYILYLWEYYVKDKGEDTQFVDEPKSEQEDVPKVESDKKDSKKNKTNTPEPGALVVVVQDGKNKDQKDTQDPGSERLYEGVGEEDLVDEEIDDRILRLLGLEDVFDIDYETYLSLLREKMAAARMGDNKYSSEEAELLTNEWKRVKGKVGRFKVKKKKIDNGFGGGPLAVRAGSFFVAQKVAFPEKDEKQVEPVGLKGIAKDIAAIRESVESILKLMESQSSILRKQIETDRKASERGSRDKKESDLESGVKKAVGLAKKVLAPAMSLLEKILSFVVKILLGHYLLKFIDWVSDKGNQKKFKTLLNFIGDWWPTLLAAFVLFATPLGGLIRFVVGTVAGLSLKLAKWGIPKLMQFAARNPYAAGALAIGGAALAANALTGQQEAASVQSDNKAKAQTGRGINLEGVGGVGDMGPTTPTGMLQGAAGGSMIGKTYGAGGKMIPSQKTLPKGGKITKNTGEKIRGAGKDTQLVAAQPGEIIISKKAVDKFGPQLFLNLNKAGGGTNVPKYNKITNLQFAAGGGRVGDAKENDVNVNMGSASAPGKIEMGNINLPETKPPNYTIKPEEPIVPNRSIGNIGFGRGQNMGGMMSMPPMGRPNININKSQPIKMSMLQKTQNTQTAVEAEKTKPSKFDSPFEGLNLQLAGVVQNPLPKTDSSEKIYTARTIKSQQSLDIPPPPEPEVTIINATKRLPKPKGTSSQPMGDRNIPNNFPVYYNSPIRDMFKSVYGLVGVN